MNSGSIRTTFVCLPDLGFNAWPDGSSNPCLSGWKALRNYLFRWICVGLVPGQIKMAPMPCLNLPPAGIIPLSQNSQLNMKIHPSVVKGTEGSRKFLELIRAYMRKGGFHVQFNVVDSRMLKDAQADPDKFRSSSSGLQDLPNTGSNSGNKSRMR